MEITRTITTRCPGPTPQAYRQIIVDVNGTAERLTLGPVSAVPALESGDRVRINRIKLQPGVRAPAGSERYQFSDISSSWVWCRPGLLELSLSNIPP